MTQPNPSTPDIRLVDTGSTLPFEPEGEVSHLIGKPRVVQSIYQIVEATPAKVKLATDILNLVQGDVTIFTEAPTVEVTAYRAVPQSEETRTVRVQRSVFRAFWALCHSLKPISDTNVEYFKRRWKAAWASDPTRVLSYENLEDTGREAPGLAICDHLDMTQLPRLFKCLAESPDRLRKAVGGQLLLLCQGHGMSYVSFIESFISAKMCVGIIAPTVCEEAVKFVRIVRSLKNQHQADFQYLGLTNPSILEPLHTRNYPDLYKLAILWSKEQGLLRQNYKMSEHRGVLSTGQLRRLSRQNVSRRVGWMTEATRQNLTELGYGDGDVETIKNRIQGSEGKKKRRRRESSDSESEDSD